MRKGYTGNFNWIFNVLFLKKIRQNMSLPKSWMVGVWVLVILVLILFCILELFQNEKKIGLHQH